MLNFDKIPKYVLPIGTKQRISKQLIPLIMIITKLLSNLKINKLMIKLNNQTTYQH